jgi:transposase
LGEKEAKKQKKKYPCENQKLNSKETSMSQYSVKLTEAQRRELEEVVKKGEAPARKIQRANILLKTDSGKYGPCWSIKRIQEALGVGSTLVKDVRRQYKQEGMERALNRQPQPPRPQKQKIDGEQEAHIIAVLCTEKPEGQERWTLRALNERIIELEIVEQVSHETVRTVLKKNKLKPWQEKQWCVGPKGDGNYICNMEDVLKVYKRPYNQKYPVVCLDEGSVQFRKEEIAGLPMKPGRVKKRDYHYSREGYCNIFLACEPLTGKRFTKVTERRTKVEFAHFVRSIVQEQYRDAEKVILVMDNLSTHHLGALYQVFPAEEASAICDRIEMHMTPVNGSWLDMAEIELSVLGRQVLDERLENIQVVQEKVAAWEAKRNRQRVTIDWRFTTKDARIKLKRLYPEIKETSEDPKGTP